jgi:uncharacterized membrane protein
MLGSKKLNQSFFFFPAEFGGTMGLFLGASFLTIIEILDLICLIIAFLFRKRQ